MKCAESSIIARNLSQSAFSRIDLLAMTLALGILATTLLPALARVHVNTQGAQCLYNLRQLTAGWWMYANDNEGKMVPNRGLFPANPDYLAYPKWVAGNMVGNSGSTASYTGIDETNSALLINPTYSQLAAYVKNPALYRCPTDQSTWSTSGTPGQNEQPRVRSYSMNNAVGCGTNGTLQDFGHKVIGYWLSTGNANPPGGYPWRVYTKASDLVAPAPSHLFLMLDEHPDSINDAVFAIQMPVSPSSTPWIDVPAKYHQNGCDFSFADGHVEYHQWQTPQSIPAAVWAADTMTGVGSGESSSPRNPDVMWLAHRTSALAPGAPAGTYQP